MAIAAMAQKALFLHGTDGITNVAPTAMIDEITFSDDASQMTITSNGSAFTLSTAAIIEMTYAEAPTTATINFNGETPEITNPYFLKGVTVTTNGGHVTINNANVTEELTFTLSGATENGSLTYNGDYKTTFILNGVSITNPNGGAIDIECGKRIAMELKKGTVNSLVDGVNGKQKAALYCKGHLEIDKTGTLNVTGNLKHALCAKEYIQLKKSDGNINILSSKSDGIHCGQYFLANGYTVTINNVEGDGIQAELSGATPYEEDYPDGSITIQGGTFNITCNADDAVALKADSNIEITDAKAVPTLVLTTSGNASKAIKAKGNVSITNGDITISQTGAHTYDATAKEASYVNAISASGDVMISGGKVNITNASDGGKGISADGKVTISGGDIDITVSGNGFAEDNEAYTSKAINADSDINITAGTVTLEATGTGGKGIKTDTSVNIGDATTHEGPTLTVSTTGASYKVAGSTSGTSGSGGGWGGGGWGRPGGGWDQTDDGSSTAKAIKAMASINVYGGDITVTTTGTGAEGIEGKTGVDIAGGTLYVKTVDDCINSGGQIKFNGGTTVCHSTGNDAVDSNYGRAGAIVIGNGNLLTYSTKGGPEMGLDCDGNSFIQITGDGTVIALGGNQGGSGSSTLSTASKGYAILTTTLSHSTGRYYTVADSAGNNLVTYSVDGSLSSTCTFITAKGMEKGKSYTLKYSTTKPTDATTEFHGLYLGSTASGTTSMTTFTAK